MSRDRKLRKKLKDSPDYDVGYAKPPVDTRFKPGQSGNPNGRPKRSRNKQSGQHEERLKDIILEEAYRGIAVKEGDRSVTLPMARAIVRAITLNAVKGDHRAQQLFAEMLARTEASRRADYEKWLETAIGYKVGWERELERRARLRITGLPEPVPHPDHVQIDFVENTVSVIGPATKEEKELYDFFIERREVFEQDLKSLLEEREAARDAERKASLDEDIASTRHILEIINSKLPG